MMVFLWSTSLRVRDYLEGNEVWMNLFESGTQIQVSVPATEIIRWNNMSGLVLVKKSA